MTPLSVRIDILPPTGQGPNNELVLTNKSGVLVTDYPLQFGRPFLQGEIKNYPQVLLDGQPVATQADIKNRYPDGSVKYAVISLIVFALPVGVPVILSFKDQAVGNNAPLGPTEMLALDYDFDAVMELEFLSGHAASASARSMLEAGKYKIWTSGTIAQTIELGDDITRSYDIGSGDSFRPFRPRFYATFWPALRKVKVRFVGENGLTTELSDLRYKLTLKTGFSQPKTVYSLDLSGGINNKLHWAMTQWTKNFWLDLQPEQKININYGLEYLSATKYFPNYDSKVVVTETVLAKEYSDFKSKPNDLYDGTWNQAGIWQTGMPTAGGRRDIGPYPTWSAMWLFTGDWRLREISLTTADLAGCWPAQIRESDLTRRFNRTDSLGSNTGLGRVISAAGRPTLYFVGPTSYGIGGTQQKDNVVVVGPMITKQGELKWIFDGAHQPQAFYPQYILTGDPHYLSQMFMWAGLYALGVVWHKRGPTGIEGSIENETRGAAWIVRGRAEAAFAAPDNTPEKPFFEQLTIDAIARWEGGMQISGTSLSGTPMAEFGRAQGNFYSSQYKGNFGPFSGKPPALHAWESNGNPVAAPDTNSTVKINVNAGIWQPAKVGSFTSPWMQIYLQYALGRLQELGFPVEALQVWSGQWLIEAITVSHEPRIFGVYQIPVERLGGGYFSWEEILTEGFTADWLLNELPVYWNRNQRPDDRQGMAGAGLSSLIDANAPNAHAAYDWYLANVYTKIDYSTDPKWAIVPRV